MRNASLLSLVGALVLPSFFVVGCASAPPPKATDVETTSAVIHSKEAFTPPDQWEMQIAEKPSNETSKDAPATKVAPGTTAAKRQTGGLVTMPGKPPSTPTPAK